MKTKTKVTAAFCGTFLAVFALIPLLVLGGKINSFWLGIFPVAVPPLFGLSRWSSNRYFKKHQNRCIRCGEENPPESTFCQTCGKKLDG